MPSLDMWANLLRVLSVEGIDRQELAPLLSLSKRAVRLRILASVRRGWVYEQNLRKTHPQVGLTDQGAFVTSQWGPLEKTSEEKWQILAGIDQASRLRQALQALVPILPLEYPHYPASYGEADASITGGPGKDWKPVPRNNGNSVTRLPLTALLSQALVAFAIDYEKLSPVALILSIRIIKRIPPQGRSVHDLGDSVGISALIRHGFLHETGTGHDRIVHLTHKGLAVKEAYDERIAAVEAGWREQFGPERIDALRETLTLILTFPRFDGGYGGSQNQDKKGEL